MGTFPRESKTQIVTDLFGVTGKKSLVESIGTIPNDSTVKSLVEILGIPQGSETVLSLLRGLSGGTGGNTNLDSILDTITSLQSVVGTLPNGSDPSIYTHITQIVQILNEINGEISGQNINAIGNMNAAISEINSIFYNLNLRESEGTSVQIDSIGGTTTISQLMNEIFRVNECVLYALNPILDHVENNDNDTQVYHIP